MLRIIFTNPFSLSFSRCMCTVQKSTPKVKYFPERDVHEKHIRLVCFFFFFQLCLELGIHNKGVLWGVLFFRQLGFKKKLYF